LFNDSNTCYLNSALQALNSCHSNFHTTPQQQVSGKLAKAVIKLFAGQRCLREVIQEIKKENWSVHQQRDAAEFIEWLFEIMERQGSGELLLEFKAKNTKLSPCTKCLYQRIIKSSSSMQYLTSKGNTLQERLDNYFVLQTTCITCEEEFEKNRYSFETYPKFLLLRTDDAFDAAILEEKIILGGNRYQITGVCIQYGSYQGGHYVAIVRDTQRWMYCNDSIVHELSHPIRESGTACLIVLSMLETKKAGMPRNEISTPTNHSEISNKHTQNTGYDNFSTKRYRVSAGDCQKDASTFNDKKDNCTTTSNNADETKGSDTVTQSFVIQDMLHRKSTLSDIYYYYEGGAFVGQCTERHFPYMKCNLCVLP